MRATTLVVLLAFTACATPGEKPAAAPPKAEPAAAAAAPAAAPPAAERYVAIEFASAELTRLGGTVGDTRYSEKPDDAAITKKQVADGVLTYEGQVGFGKGSQWAGIGFSANIQPDAKPMVARQYKTVTFKLASPTTGALRLRIIGPEDKIRNAGCYPIYMQAVTKDLTEYTIPLSRFAAESYCGAQARSTDQTLGELVGFEVVDVAMKKAPTSFSSGSITLSP
jgi:pyruvate/2-oxoglutarate dehydrogenase complex dihydrolipoamide acyltransferase (E2) component